MVAAYVLFGASVVLFLVALLLVARVLLRERSWVEAQAEILESSVEPFIDSKSERQFRGVFLLRYKADRDIREALVRSSVAFPTREAAVAYSADRPVGSRWPIHYDPHAPSQVNATLTLGAAAYSHAIACALFGVAGLIAGASVWFLSIGPEW